MTEEKRKKLEVYLAKVRDSLASPTPAKQKIREGAYREFLKREEKKTKAALDKGL